MFSRSFIKILRPVIISKRFMKTLSLKFRAHGEPLDVLEMVEEELPEPDDDQCLIKVLLAPINPADINIIQGRYPLKPCKMPATGGNEFVGEVLKKGEKVDKVVLNEHVIPYESGIGTWSKYLLLNEKQIYPVPFSLPLPEAATLTVNPCTAYRMLKDFIKLRPGDCVIQNGANSAVGQAVHQLCKHYGLKSVGIVRDREDIVLLKQYLLRLGATEIFTEEELLKTKVFESGCLPKPRLALNCVGGESAHNIAKLLEHKGIMVTYGGMSRKPISINAANMIFKRHTFHGFWITDWVKRNADKLERKVMLQDLVDLSSSNSFKAPTHTIIPFEEYKKYAKKIMSFGHKTNQKFIFDMTKKYEGSICP